MIRIRKSPTADTPTLEITRGKLLDMIDDILMNAVNDLDALRYEHYISEKLQAKIASEIANKIADYEAMRELIVAPETVIIIK